jgi:hypothetical protein
MTEYRYFLVDASTGLNICELPLQVSSPCTRVLTGVGSFAGSLPVDHPSATQARLQGDRELTVVRNDTPVWNGPFSMVAGAIPGTVDINAREASWTLFRRTLEVDKHYDKDTHKIVRSLDSYAESKVSTAGDGTGGAGSSINAAIPRFAVSTGDSGVTKEVTLSGAARHTIGEIIDYLVQDPDTGLEYRMDYRTGSVRSSCRRTLTLGSPLGVTKTQSLTERVLYSYSREMDWERAATRVHVVGAQGRTETRQNTGSITSGLQLMEAVFDRSDTSSTALLSNMAREARRKSQPPVRTFSVSFTPSDSLPFDFCDLGDKVSLDINWPSVLNTNATRRVVQIDLMPPQADTPELVTLSFNLPLDELGT